ncbi:MAG: hypothetical protein F4207_14945 [Gemmatimonadetes bacterium]|nr:hypothetical protein [Gemmatimonadota bacterium]MYG17699.1 hypothetical protein [Gemmatimonadota bacterium]MYH20307.1 hypothetical protein [Gemmatimonadota bacterium]MYK99617.1 hypothetical protein [Gemmatimonadota bacterium]
MSRLSLGLVCVVFLPASLFVHSSCGKDSSTNPTPPSPSAPVPTSIEITPSSATLNAIDQTVQLAPVVLDENGAEIADASVTWTSGAVDVATVSGQGLVTAINNGSAVITAQSGSFSASASITVSQVPVRIVIEVPPPGGQCMQTDTGQCIMVATVQDRNGHPVAGAEVTWSSSDESVVTIDDQGVVTEVSSGRAQITARSGDLSDSVSYSVSGRVALGRLYEATNGPDWTDNTNWLTDAHAKEWHGVTVGLFGQLVILDLNNNNLVGSLPMDVGQLWTLEELNLGSNRISGEIPATIGKLEYLGKLNLSDNQLSGEIPAGLGRLEELEVLALDKNQLTGVLSAELGYLANLRELHLQENESLNGPLPDSFTNLELQILNLGGTALCVPASPEFQTWIEGIDNVTAATCPDPEIEAP